MAKREFISREEALSHPFANGKYDRKNADINFILGHESYKEWLETLPVFTEQEIAKPYFDRLSNEVLKATWDAYYMPVNTLPCDEIQKLMDKVLSDKEEV